MKTVFAILISFFSFNAAYAKSTLSCLLSTTTAPLYAEKKDGDNFYTQSFLQVLAIDYDPSLYSDYFKGKIIYFGYVEKEDEYLNEMVPVDSKEKATLEVSFAARGNGFGIYIEPVGYGRGNKGIAVLDPRETKTTAASTAYRASANGGVVISTISCAVKK